LGGDTAEFGEGGLVADAVGVISCGHQELAGQLDTDTEESDELGGGEGDEGLDLAVERFDLGVERLPAAGEIPQSGLDAGEEEPLRLTGQLQEVIDLGTKPQARLTSVRLARGTSSSRSGDGAPIMTPNRVLYAWVRDFSALARVTRKVRITSTIPDLDLGVAVAVWPRTERAICSASSRSDLPSMRRAERLDGSPRSRALRPW
jgi:hypothetical protein